MGGARITPSSASRCARPMLTPSSVPTTTVGHTGCALRFTSPRWLEKGRHGAHGCCPVVWTHGRTDRNRIEDRAGGRTSRQASRRTSRRASASPTRHGRAGRRVRDALRRLAHEAGPAGSDLHGHDRFVAWPVARRIFAPQYSPHAAPTSDETHLGVLSRGALRARTSDPLHRPGRQGLRTPGLNVTHRIRTRSNPRPNPRHQSYKGGTNP